ncbi:unnamed protein product [Arabis nemorensis]|uniref:Uncharacterized protein n=1 Tax=Arabis nemorensis TaxID=586526 RepID=A0A565CES2_9BRAS|nr:unnamed protein product [Arabis nemorensis]
MEAVVKTMVGHSVTKAVRLLVIARLVAAPVVVTWDYKYKVVVEGIGQKMVQGYNRYWLQRS